MRHYCGESFLMEGFFFDIVDCITSLFAENIELYYNGRYSVDM
jgi:hypothetical protein